MKRTILLLFVITSCVVMNAQITENPSVGSQKSKYATVYSVKGNLL